MFASLEWQISPRAGSAARIEINHRATAPVIAPLRHADADAAGRDKTRVTPARDRHRLEDVGTVRFNCDLVPSCRRS